MPHLFQIFNPTGVFQPCSSLHWTNHIHNNPNNVDFYFYGYRKASFSFSLPSISHLNPMNPTTEIFFFWCKVCLSLANNRASKHCRRSRICSSDMCIYSQTHFLLCIFRLFVLLMRKSPRNQILCIVLHFSLFIFFFEVVWLSKKKGIKITS